MMNALAGPNLTPAAGQSIHQSHSSSAREGTLEPSDFNPLQA